MHLIDSLCDEVYDMVIHFDMWVFEANFTVEYVGLDHIPPMTPLETKY